MQRCINAINTTLTVSIYHCSVAVCQNKHTHTTVLLLVWNMSGSTRVSRYQKGKTKKVKTNVKTKIHKNYYYNRFVALCLGLPM